MGKPFTVVVPTPITDANLVSSTIAEDDYPEYNGATEYAAGERVIVSTAGVHKIFESAIAANTGNQPEDSPVAWLEVGPTSRWAAFDESGGTLSQGASPVEFVITGDLINSIALLEVTGLSVRIQASNPSNGTYYDKTITLEDSAIIDDWYEHFYAEFRKERNVVVTDIPAIVMSTYTITITGDSAAAVGTFVMGRKAEFGFTEYRPKVGIIDYSRKEVDQFGKINLIKRPYSRRMDVSIRCQNVAIDAIYRTLADLRATAVLWIGAGDLYEILTIYGFYRDFSIDIAYAKESFCSLQIEGLS